MNFNDYQYFIKVLGLEDLSQLPFGPIKDPIKELKLHASWYDLHEDIITDNDIHSGMYENDCISTESVPQKWLKCSNIYMNIVQLKS